MRIKNLKAIPIELILDEPFEGGTYIVRNRNTIVCVVEFENGVKGAMYGGDEDMEQDAIVRLINTTFKERIAGKAIESVEDIHAIYNDLMNMALNLGYRALVDLDMGRHGIQQQALSLIDMALWDGFGKLQDKPVFALLGGAKRTEIPVISIGGYYHDSEPQGTHAEAAWLKSLGLSGMKMKVGRVPFEQDVERILAAVEGGGGKDFKVAVDVNQGWTVEQSIEFCQRAANLGLAWLEEPVKWYDCLTGLAQVKASSSIPIVSGQGDISEFRSKNLVRCGSVDQLNTDATLVGGVTGWMNVAKFAAEHNVAMGHHEEPQVALTLLSVVDKIGPVEIFANEKRDPLWRLILKNPPLPKNGVLQVPQGAGLGFELDWDVVERYKKSV